MFELYPDLDACATLWINPDQQPLKYFSYFQACSARLEGARLGCWGRAATAPSDCSLANRNTTVLVSR